MQPFFKISLLLPVLFFLMGTPALAQKKPVVPAHHRELLSGGSIEIEVDLGSLAPGPSSPTRTEQPPQVGPNIRVNAPQQPFPKGLLGRSETTIAASADGLFLVAGFNDAQGFCGPPFGVHCKPEKPPGLSGFAFSNDGGLTWTDGGAPDPRRFNKVFTRGDPWLDRGGLDNATLFYANLAVDAITAAPLGISVHRGHFSGSTFNWEDVRVLGPSNPNDFFDKEAITAAKEGSGAAYVSYTNFIALPCPAFPNTVGAFGQIEVFRTHDGGNTYQGPVIVSADKTNADPLDPNCGNTGVLQQSSAPAIGPTGEVYVAWQLGPTFTSTGVSTDAKIVVARSLDGGMTFGVPVAVASINSMRQNSPVGYNRIRINDHPRITVATSGSFKGRVYAVFYSAVSPVTAASVVDCPAGLPSTAVCIDQNLDSSQVFISFSDDQGLTWSTPAPIASPVPDTGVKRWWPVVNVGPDGSVNVVYYESQETDTASNPECIKGVGGGMFRVGTANSLVDTLWVQSVDGGSSFATPVRVTTATSNWCTTVSNIRPNFGDYIGSTTSTTGGNKVLPVWADGRNGVPDTFFAAILP